MQISANGLSFIEHEEGSRTTVYHDSRGFLTVGVGHLVLPQDDLHFGDKITPQQVDKFLQKDLAWVQDTINNNTSNIVLNQNQFDALCSLVFNIGAHNFIFNSSVLRDIKVGDFSSAADAFLMWRRAGSLPNELLPRRERERTLFLTPVEETTNATL